MSEAHLVSTERTAVVRDGIAVGVATSAYGISFGAVSVGAASTCGRPASCRCSCSPARPRSHSWRRRRRGYLVRGRRHGVVAGSPNTLYGLRLADLLDWHWWRRITAGTAMGDR